MIIFILAHIAYEWKSLVPESGTIEYSWSRLSQKDDRTGWTKGDEGKAKLAMHGHDWRVLRDSSLAETRAGNGRRRVESESRSLKNSSINFYRRNRKEILGEAWLDSAVQINFDRRWGVAALVFGRLPDAGATSLCDYFPDAAAQKIGLRELRWDQPWGVLTLRLNIDGAGWEFMELVRHGDNKEYPTHSAKPDGTISAKSGILKYKCSARARGALPGLTVMIPSRIEVETIVETTDKVILKSREEMTIVSARPYSSSHDMAMELEPIEGIAVMVRDRPGIEHIWKAGEVVPVGPSNLLEIDRATQKSFRKREGGWGGVTWIGVGSITLLAVGAAVSAWRRRRT